MERQNAQTERTEPPERSSGMERQDQPGHLMLVDRAPEEVRDLPWTEVRRLVGELDPSSYEHRTPPLDAELSAQIGKHLREAQAPERLREGERSDPVRLREVPLSHPDAQKLLAWERGELAWRHPAERFPGLDARRLQLRDERVDPESAARRDEHATYLVAELDGLVLGGAGLTEYKGPVVPELTTLLNSHRASQGDQRDGQSKDRFGLVFGVFSLPVARGHGIANRTLKGVEALAQEREFSGLFLRLAGPNQPEARTLYERKGFQQSPELGYVPRLDTTLYERGFDPGNHEPNPREIAHGMWKPLVPKR